MVHSEHWSVTVHSALHDGVHIPSNTTVHCAVHTNGAINRVQCTLYSVHCTMYSVQCTVYSVLVYPPIRFITGAAQWTPYSTDPGFYTLYTELILPCIHFIQNWFSTVYTLYSTDSAQYTLDTELILYCIHFIQN